MGKTAYRGELGKTRLERVHVACPGGRMVATKVYRSISRATDPQIATRLMEGDDELNSVVCPDSDELVIVRVPLTYHDPERRVFALVLPEHLRHRELRERAAVLLALADDVEHEIPEYVQQFTVAYLGDDLRVCLEGEADGPPVDASADRARDAALASARDLLERGQSELEQMQNELEAAQRELEQVTRDALEQREDLERRLAVVEAQSRGGEASQARADSQRLELAELELSLDDRSKALERRSAELERRAEALEDAEQSGTRPRASNENTDQVAFEDLEEVLGAELDGLAAEPAAPVEVKAGESAGSIAEAIEEAIEPARRPRRRLPEPTRPEPAKDRRADAPEKKKEKASRTGSERPRTTPRVAEDHDISLEKWIASHSRALARLGSEGELRLAVSAQPVELESLLTEDHDVRFELHRLPTYPLAVLALRPRDGGKGFFAHLDVAKEPIRAALMGLKAEFAFPLEIFDGEYLPVETHRVVTDLGENVSYLLAAADEYMKRVPAADRSYDRAVVAFSGPNFIPDADTRHFSELALNSLDGPRDVREAVQIAAKFSEPSGEEALLLTSGYSLSRWHKLRRRLLKRACELGFWVGPALAQSAVSEGLARSRKDLVLSLQRNFAHLVADSGQHDLDEAAIAQNWDALQTEATALGLKASQGASPRSEPIVSEAEPVASGTIGRVTALTKQPRQKGQGNPMLERQLDDKDKRLGAAIELCRLGNPTALGAILATVRRMTRSEAGRVLGAVVSFGPVAVPHLLEGLKSRKGYVRQGCALALAVLKDRRGVEAIIDLLIKEPTEIWREVARAVGEVGTGAITNLAARLATSPEQARERIAWAMAHVSARGHRVAVERLAAGTDPVVAGVARYGLELSEVATKNDLQVRGGSAPRDQTVNRAFSRRFFQAMGSPDAVALEGEVSAPAMLLDESDLLDAGEFEEEAEVLDESDLIPT